MVPHMSSFESLVQHVPHAEIPDSEDLFPGGELDSYLRNLKLPEFSLIAVGDIMLGGRATEPISKFGASYPFEAIAPLLRRASIVLGNLEGPLADRATPRGRRYSYRIDTQTVGSLKSANIKVLNLANNHLMDCGREGVVETFDALAGAG